MNPRRKCLTTEKSSGYHWNIVTGGPAAAGFIGQRDHREKCGCVAGRKCQSCQWSILTKASYYQKTSRHHRAFCGAFSYQPPTPATHNSNNKKLIALYFYQMGKSSFSSQYTKASLEHFRNMLGRTVPENKPSLPFLQVEKSSRCKWFPLHQLYGECLRFFFYGLWSCTENPLLPQG